MIWRAVPLEKKGSHQRSDTTDAPIEAQPDIYLSNGTEVYTCSECLLALPRTLSSARSESTVLDRQQIERIGQVVSSVDYVRGIKQETLQLLREQDRWLLHAREATAHWLPSTTASNSPLLEMTSQAPLVITGLQSSIHVARLMLLARVQAALGKMADTLLFSVKALAWEPMNERIRDEWLSYVWKSVGDRNDNARALFLKGEVLRRLGRSGDSIRAFTSATSAAALEIDGIGSRLRELARLSDAEVAARVAALTEQLNGAYRAWSDAGSREDEAESPRLEREYREVRNELVEMDGRGAEKVRLGEEKRNWEALQGQIAELTATSRTETAANDERWLPSWPQILGEEPVWWKTRLFWVDPSARLVGLN